MALMAQWCGKCRLEVWAYCLMPNHVHLVVVPAGPDGLRRGIGEAHRRYTCRVNSRQGWRGHLWQGRFASYVMDESHLLAAVRYVETNPVRAGLAASAGRWPWSSAAAHLAGRDDLLVTTQPMLELVWTLMADWQAYLDLEMPAETLARLRRHQRTGRPLGSEVFVAALEESLGRTLKPKSRGRPKKPKK